MDVHRYNDEYVINRLKSKQYDAICMGCIVTGYSIVKRLSAMCRKYNPNACIIVGNSVATSIYQTLLEKTEADIAIMGEGDITIVNVLKTVEEHRNFSEVNGICYIKDGNIIRNKSQAPIEDISTLPHIDFSIFDVEEYINNSKEQVSECDLDIAREDIRALPVNTARGCIGNCTFCYQNFRGYKYRYRSVESIINEIREMINKYDLNYILFGDELTLFSKKRAEELADAIIESELHFYFCITCRADCFTKDSDVEILKKLRRAGCVQISYSLESSNPDILKAMNKHITLEQFARTTRLCYEAGITPGTSLVIGYPQETVQTIADTFKCCEDNRIYPSSGYLLPQPGSVIYDYACENGYIKDEEEYLLMMGDRQDLRLNMTNMKDEEMEKAVLDGLRKVNRVLDVGLDESSLIKTKYYRQAKSKYNI